MKFVIETKLVELLVPAFELITRKKNWEFEISDTCGEGIFVCDVESLDGEVAEFIKDKELSGKWNLVYQTDNGFVVSGAGKLEMLHAALRAVDFIKYPAEEKVKEFRVSQFKKYYENYDDFSFAFARAADDFDLEIHMIDMVRVGVENFEINMLYDDIPIQIREREDSRDMYPWWCSYMPTLDMYYETSITKGIYTDDMLAENRSVLLNAARLCDVLGLKPMFTVFEPRYMPERFFLRYPETRGARVDRDTYSITPEYAPDVTHPIILKHYRELFDQLMTDVPNLDTYEIWSQDSNAGFPWARALYQKANGPTRLYGTPLHKIVNTFLVNLRDSARKYNPDTRIHLNIDWCYIPEEKVELIENLPEGIGLTFGYRLTDDGKIENIDLISKLPGDYIQALSENIGNRWKYYAPLTGFPTPREAHRITTDIYNNGVRNLTIRGGIHTDVFVPHNINNEVVRELKFNPGMDIDEFLKSVAKRWGQNPEEREALYKVWEICDKFNDQYETTRKYRGYFSWTTTMFVSARTLFRRLIMPIVPDAKSLTFNETRYYRPHVFFCAKSDPSWHDMSFFNFRQIDDDDKMIHAYTDMENLLIPYLCEAMNELDKVKKYNNHIVTDLYDRIKAFYHITVTEKLFMQVQVAVHQYAAADDEGKKTIRANIRKWMLEEIENTEGFIKLLRETESVLIPTTSGEETTYMYKTPMDNLLVRKIKVMKARLDDEPKAVEALPGSSNDYLHKH